MPSTRSLLSSFLAERALSVSAHTVAGDQSYLLKFFAFLEGLNVDEVAAIAPEHLQRYLDHLQSTPGKRGQQLSWTYLHRCLALPRMFLLWALQAGHTMFDVSSFALPYRPHSIQTVPTVAQVRQLLEAPDLNTPAGLRDRLLFEFFYVLGLRRREAWGLELSSLDLGRRTVLVDGKGYRERLLPLSPQLFALVERYLKEGRPYLRPHPDETGLWVTEQTGRRLGFGSLRERVLLYSKALGLKLHPHLLRHACATHLLEAGAEIEHIQQLLGHSQASSTERYAQVQKAELLTEHQRHHPRAHLKKS